MDAQDQTGSDGFISDLQKAQTVAELNKLLEQAKNEIDAIIDQDSGDDLMCDNSLQSRSGRGMSEICCCR